MSLAPPMWLTGMEKLLCTRERRRNENLQGLGGRVGCGGLRSIARSAAGHQKILENPGHVAAYWRLCASAARASAIQNRRAPVCAQDLRPSRQVDRKAKYSA